LLRVAVLDGEVGGAFAESGHPADDDPGAEAAPVATSVAAKRCRQSTLLAEPPLVPGALSLAETAVGWLSTVTLHGTRSVSVESQPSDGPEAGVLRLKRLERPPEKRSASLG